MRTTYDRPCYAFAVPLLALVTISPRLWAFWERQIMRGAEEVVTWRSPVSDHLHIEVYPSEPARSALACRFLYRLIASTR